MAIHVKGGSTLSFFSHVMQMVGIYKDPKGENIFQKSSMTDPTAVLNATPRATDSTELYTLRRRVKDLENELEKEKV